VKAIEALDARYNSQSKGNRTLALRQLLNKKFDEREQPLEEFLNEKYNLMKERLRDTVTADEIVTLAIILNLPTAYQAVTAPMLTREVLTYEELKDGLLEFNAVKNSAEETDAHVLKGGAGSGSSSSTMRQEVAAAVNAAFQKGKGKGSWDKGKGKGKKGKNQPPHHIVKKQGDKDKDKKPLLCWRCNKPGHKAAECP